MSAVVAALLECLLAGPQRPVASAVSNLRLTLVCMRALEDQLEQG